MRRCPASSSSWPAWVDTSTMRPSAAARAQPVGQPLPAGGVEAGAGLVEHEDLRIGQQRERETQPLAHPAGELADPCRRVRRSARLPRGARRSARAARGGCRHRAASCRSTVRSGWRPPRLRHVADQGADRAPVGTRVEAGDADLAVEVGDAQQAAEQRGLAGAVGAEQQRDFTGHAASATRTTSAVRRP